MHGQILPWWIVGPTDWDMELYRETSGGKLDPGGKKKPASWADAGIFGLPCRHFATYC